MKTEIESTSGGLRSKLVADSSAIVYGQFYRHKITSKPKPNTGLTLGSYKTKKKP
jgi:hypothetical protein